MNNKKPRLSAKQSQELTKLITITKTATLKAVMDPGELAKVIAVVASDLDQTAEMLRRFRSSGTIARLLRNTTRST